MPAHRPDVGIVHAQRADRRGNVQLWGILGVQKECVLASRALDRHRRGDRRRACAGAGRDRAAGVGGRRRLRRAARRASVVRARLLRPRQRLLPRVGRDQPRPRRVPGLDGRARARRRCPRDRTRRRDDGGRGRAPARRRYGLLRRHRPAEPRREPRAAHARARAACSSTRAARSARSRTSCRSRSATASSRRPRTRSSPSRRCSRTGSRAAASTSASSAPRRSTGTATSTAP